MGGLIKSKAPKATPVPTADPMALQAQFVAGDTEDPVSKKKKAMKKGKSSLTVKRVKGAGTARSSKTGSGLSVGK